VCVWGGGVDACGWCVVTGEKKGGRRGAGGRAGNEGEHVSMCWTGHTGGVGQGFYNYYCHIKTKCYFIEQGFHSHISVTVTFETRMNPLSLQQHHVWRTFQACAWPRVPWLQPTGSGTHTATSSLLSNHRPLSSQTDTSALSGRKGDGGLRPWGTEMCVTC